ncbi:VCBS repeat-containing protein [bacterium]|nr:VCBS repeat-containing protein [bacterium]
MIRTVFAFVAATAAILTATAAEDALKWNVHTINADSKFEAAGVADVNGDGKKDILCGEFWYEAPKWEKHKFATLPEQHEYFDDFAHAMQDVDGDGDIDLVSCTWFSQEIFWRENPNSCCDEWVVHSVDKPGNMETGLEVDINQDGEADFLPNISSIVAWYEKSPKKPEWSKREVGKQGAGHGLGYGDVDKDGMIDLVTPHGWYKSSKKGDEIEWIWFGEFELGTASVPIEVHDVNGDGVNDVVWGFGHDYGVYWFEQGLKDGKRTWTKHDIDKSWSQAHYIRIIDLKNDGKKYLVTGKRYRAHNGGDPGSSDPLCVYAYEYDPAKKDWIRHTIHEGGTVGFGLNPAITDIDGDGDVDLILPGKSGLYFIEAK